MPRDFMTDDQVEREIQRLLNSPHVRLAKNDEKRRYRRRQYMYALRSLEKKGIELERSGITPDELRSMYCSEPEYNNAEQEVCYGLPEY